MATDLNLIQRSRDFAEALAVPVFIVDRAATLLYYNPPAERILGRRFSETGELQGAVWTRLFIPADENGDPLMPEQLPLIRTVNEQRPASLRFWIRGLDNELRHIEVTTFPLTSQSGTFLGAAAMFWEIQ
jgi:PAS domain-containing protein